MADSSDMQRCHCGSEGQIVVDDIGWVLTCPHCHCEVGGVDGDGEAALDLCVLVWNESVPSNPCPAPKIPAETPGRMTVGSYRFAPVVKARMSKVSEAADQLEFSLDELLGVMPEEEVEPGGLITDYVRSARGCIEGAKKLLATARDEMKRIEGETPRESNGGGG